MGITNTISRADLEAITAAVIHGYSHLATDSLTSLHQIKKQLSHPNLHRHHIQGNVLQSIAKAIRQSPSPIHFIKIKPHAGIIGNEHADALAKSQPPPPPTLLTPPSEQQALRGIPSATSTGLQKKTQKTKHKPIIIPIYMQQTWPILLPKSSGTYQTTVSPSAHMHLLHKLGNAKTEANYHAYYQTLIKGGTANGATSNAYLTSSNVSYKTKCIIMKYRTGTLYNQKHAVSFKLSTSQTCPLCPQVDSALHILSGCQHMQIRNMITERQLSMPHDL